MDDADCGEFRLASELLCPETRALSWPLTCLAGGCVGALAYMGAEWLTPASPTCDVHLLELLRRLAFVWAVGIGLWVGWLQRSWTLSLQAIGAGLVLALAYSGFTLTCDRTELLVALPCLLGGIYCTVVGSLHSLPARRLGRGLLAVSIATVAAAFVFTWLSSRYILRSEADSLTMFRQIGPIVMAFWSGLLFPLITWAMCLRRVSAVPQAVDQG